MDGLHSGGVAGAGSCPKVRHQGSRYLSSRAENLQRPTRCREYWMQGFKSRGRAQRFLPFHSMTYDHFRHGDT
jgi:transposase-like protein